MKLVLKGLGSIFSVRFGSYTACVFGGLPVAAAIFLNFLPRVEVRYRVPLGGHSDLLLSSY